MRRHLSIIWTLIAQRFASRDSRDRFRLLWIFVEPIGQMAVLMTIFTIIGRTAAYGRSFPLFLIAGLAVLNLFNRGAQMAKGAMMGLSRQSRLATIGMFDDAIARVAFVSLVTIISTGGVLYGIAVFTRVETMPKYWDRVAAAVFWVALMAFGFGMLRAWSAHFAPVLERVYAIVTRGLIFVSGVFYMPSFLPPALRDLIVWNPLMHGVELLRLGIYREYPTTVYDERYLAGVALGSTALGMLLLWSRRSAIMG